MNGLEQSMYLEALNKHETPILECIGPRNLIRIFPKSLYSIFHLKMLYKISSLYWHLCYDMQYELTVRERYTSNTVYKFVSQGSVERTFGLDVC